MMCEATIRFIQRHAEKARVLAQTETDAWQRQTYLRVAECCEHLATQPPRSYYEGVQWIHFAVLLDRVVGHGNGYGRLDLYLIDLYRRSKAAGELSDEDLLMATSAFFDPSLLGEQGGELWQGR